MKKHKRRTYSGTLERVLLRRCHGKQARDSREDVDAGAAQIEFVLLAPFVVLTLSIMPIELGMWWHTRHMMVAAAHEGARSAAEFGKTPAAAQRDGQTAVTNFVGNNRSVDINTVVINRGAEEVRVRIDGRVESVVPGITWNRTVEVTAPVERFVSR